MVRTTEYGATLLYIQWASRTHSLTQPSDTAVPSLFQSAARSVFLSFESNGVEWNRYDEVLTFSLPLSSQSAFQRRVMYWTAQPLTHSKSYEERKPESVISLSYVSLLSTIQVRSGVFPSRPVEQIMVLTSLSFSPLSFTE